MSMAVPDRDAGSAALTPPAGHSDAAGAPATCRLCGVLLAGAYCGACGQPSSRARRSIRETLLGQSGRLLHTLRLLLTRPGELAMEIDEGRDRDSLKPLTLLFHLMAAFFLISTFTGFGVTAVLDLGVGFAQGWVDAAIAHMGVPRDLGMERLQHRFQTVYTLFMPLDALAVGGAFILTHRRAPKPWIVPVAAGLHYRCFTLLWLGGLLWGLRAAGLRAYASGPVLLVEYLVGATYVSLMLRRMYGEPWLPTIAKGMFALLCGSAVANTLIFAAVYIVTHV